MSTQQQLNNVNMWIVILGVVIAILFAISFNGLKGRLLKIAGIIVSIVIIYLGYKQHQLGGTIDIDNIKKEDKLALQHSQDSMQKSKDKRDLIDTINNSLRPFKIILDKNDKAETITQFITNNYQGLKQRHLTPELLTRIQSTIKNKNEFVGIYSMLSDKESETLRNEITDKLKSMNYHIMWSMSLNGAPNLSIPQLYDSVFIKRENINGDTGNCYTGILIYPLSNAN